eukprot:scaffold131552_cov57-Phaeocystis_antarctica.AAC.1
MPFLLAAAPQEAIHRQQGVRVAAREEPLARHDGGALAQLRGHAGLRLLDAARAEHHVRHPRREVRQPRAAAAAHRRDQRVVVAGSTGRRGHVEHARAQVHLLERAAAIPRKLIGRRALGHLEQALLRADAAAHAAGQPRRRDDLDVPELLLRAARHPLRTAARCHQVRARLVQVRQPRAALALHVGLRLHPRLSAQPLTRHDYGELVEGRQQVGLLGHELARFGARLEPSDRHHRSLVAGRVAVLGRDHAIADQVGALGGEVCTDEHAKVAGALARQALLLRAQPSAADHQPLRRRHRQPRSPSAQHANPPSAPKKPTKV